MTKAPFRASLALLALLNACSRSSERPDVGDASATPPPAPSAMPYRDTLHGVEVADPFRWLEDSTDIRVQQWMRSEGEYASAVLQQVVAADSIESRIARMFTSLSTLGRVSESSAGLLIERWLGSSPSLMAVNRDQTAERTLLTDSALAAARGGARLRAFVPSWDGRLVALGTTTDGDRAPSISVLDVAQGRLLSDEIPDLLATTSGSRYEVTWLPDGSGFIYPREWPGAASGPSSARLERGRQFVHRIGTPQAADVPLFGFDVSAAVPVAPEDLPTRVHTAPGTNWMVGAISRIRRNGSELYGARLAQDSRGQFTTPQWKRIAEVDDRMSAVQLRGDTVYAVSRRSDRGAIVRRVLREPLDANTRWDTVVPERSGVIVAIAVQADALYFTERTGGAVALYRRRWSDGSTTRVTLPYDGGLALLRRPPHLAGVTFGLATWATTPRYFRVEEGAESSVPLGLDDGGSAATGSVRSERIEVRSRDGTLVPVSVVYDPQALASRQLDGRASLLIESYGGFGRSTDPEFMPHVTTWVALGGVYAYAHVRGGGELGDAWHRAATRDGKQRTLDDMIAAIEGLIARRYTSAGRVVLSGFSFGAHIPGLLLAQRPDLLGAIVFGAGTPDEIRGAAFDPTARRNLNELGDLESAAGIRLLLKASPYHQVPQRVELPAMIVQSTGADYNFGSEMLVAKYVARLRTASTSARPLLWLRTDAGHVPLFDGNPQLAARVYAFLLWQTGDTRYQPR